MNRRNLKRSALLVNQKKETMVNKLIKLPAMHKSSLIQASEFRNTQINCLKCSMHRKFCPFVLFLSFLHIFSFFFE